MIIYLFFRRFWDKEAPSFFQKNISKRKLLHRHWCTTFFLRTPRRPHTPHYERVSISLAAVACDHQLQLFAREASVPTPSFGGHFLPRFRVVRNLDQFRPNLTKNSTEIEAYLYQLTSVEKVRTATI